MVRSPLNIWHQSVRRREEGQPECSDGCASFPRHHRKESTHEASRIFARNALQLQPTVVTRLQDGLEETAKGALLCRRSAAAAAGSGVDGGAIDAANIGDHLIPAFLIRGSAIAISIAAASSLEGTGVVIVARE